MRTPWEVRQERWQQEEREENNQASRARTHLQAALVELLDGDGDAVPPAVGRADEALVDAAEAALAELLRAAEVGGGGLELLVVEHPQLAVAPLLVQRRDAPLRLRRGGRPRRLAHRPHRAGVVRPARAHPRHRGGRRGGGRRAGRRRRRRPALPRRRPAAPRPPLEPAQAAHDPPRHKLLLLQRQLCESRRLSSRVADTSSFSRRRRRSLRRAASQASGGSEVTHLASL